MLNLRKVLGAKPKDHVAAELETLLTPWGEEIIAREGRRVLEEHPDPQFEREVYKVLNGRWSCAFVRDGHEPTADLSHVVANASVPPHAAFAQSIIVPFSPEAPLSGVGRQLQPDELLWYRCAFIMPDIGRTLRCLLHFQAVDYACSCRVNGKLAGTHVGGYLPFTFDITDLLEEGENELLVCVADPSELGGRVRGKQRFDRGDIWYTAQSGIWQAVWLEVVPEQHIASVQIEPDASTGILAVGARCVMDTGGMPRSLKMKVHDAEGELVAAATCAAERSCAMAVHIPDVHLWSPDDPYLYRLRFTLGDDKVESYCAFRSVEVRMGSDGNTRVHLNGEPLFIRGVLDQAYWSDGLMSAPADAALVFDIKSMRAAGFNLMRKHVKVESARWYYHCDQLGMLVLQDMVSGGAPEINLWNWSYKPTLFKASWSRYRDDIEPHQRKLGAGNAAYRDEWTETACGAIEALRNHPCIIGWSLFNEGWGQFDARAACAMVRRLDPTRAIDATSGWYDQGCGDFTSVHNYFRDLKVWKSRLRRAFLISEFGGFSHRVDAHSSLDECYGYEVYDNVNEWRAAFADVIAHVNALEDEGLAGYMYTQVSDIEEETNGILTYDRRVNKLINGHGT